MLLWRILFGVGAILSLIGSLIADYGPSRGDISFTKDVGVKGRRRRPKKSQICITKPEPPINGFVHCSPIGFCVATCKDDYKFPAGETEIAIECVNNKWSVVGTNSSGLPHCEPICMPECLNNGVCVEPQQCNCPQNFKGPQCQFENKPCLNRPPDVVHAKWRCDSNTMYCTIYCEPKFAFPDGTQITNLICKDGNWEPTREDWVSVPDCKPVCDPPCQNGGICLPSNTCQCPAAYKGLQCQYSSDTCTKKNLAFNGYISCTMNDESFVCTLTCPRGVEFEFSPAAAYACTYDKGVFEPQPIPQCMYDKSMQVISNQTTFKETEHWVNNASYGYNITSSSVVTSYVSDYVIVIERIEPKPKTCFTWGGVNYKTFDDVIYSFQSDCSHLLVQEAQDRLFTIIVDNSLCDDQRCSKIIIFLQEEQYILSRNENGIPEFRTPSKLLPIPAQLPHLRIEMSAHFIVVTLDTLGIKLKWDGGLMVQVEAHEKMWNRTVGLCGNMNGDEKDDLVDKNGEPMSNIAAFANRWRTEKLGETCDSSPVTRSPCDSDPVTSREAIQFCLKLLSDRRYRSCSNTINLGALQEACLWDYCACQHEDRRKCSCDTMNVYVRQCAHKKITSLTDWRNDETCPMVCTNGRVYMSCGPKTESSCWTAIERKINLEECEEGCFCPEGTVAHEGRCISREECPCRLRGKIFQPGSSVPKDCNTCQCVSGEWSCTQTRCSARCAVVGDPHYTTFDGKRYDFMGKCRYYLMKGDDYSIEGENVPCSGAISENMGLVPPDAPSCTKTVTINYQDVSIKLKQHRQVLINGDDLTVFPTVFKEIRIRIASSILLVVHLPNGLEVWWDGMSRVYINAPPEFHGKTKGLCGTFSENQKDDFLTPEGDVENMAISFANKWKTEETCPSVPEKETDHPCSLDPQKRDTAKQYCAYLLSDIFAGCHWHVDPEAFYKDCLFDMCSCKVDVEACLCPTLAAYAKECAAAGIKLSWRYEISECRIQCPGSQVYQICGNSCTRSCGDISSHQNCKQECVEGCNCPEGETLNIHGECIPIGQCPCMYQGMEFKTGHKEIRREIKVTELCTCAGGVWNCKEATPEEIKEYPETKELMSSCVASKYLEITDCAPVEPRTCYNMHRPVQPPSICKSGCVCMAGYVFDEPNGNCVKEDSCPCHHGGQSYKENSVIQSDCNTCKCANGTWKCTDRTCSGVCSAWGDSHYKTFDGKIYDFQGMCDYVLAKGVLNKEESFDVVIQNVPCGTTGVACSKSVTLFIKDSGSQESIVLTRGKEVPSGNYKRIAIRKTELFVFVDVPDIGLTLQWDKGTRVYVKLDPRWKGRTNGLCGDYNDNAEDDFKTPSGGIPEVSVNLFGDSWKQNDMCPEPKDVIDTCEQHPERSLWATEKCGILKSSVFQPCHTEVEVESYLRNCIFDSCGCDAGGDCECLCTAVAAYAQECNAKGVPIKWRSQELCPIQCDEKCSSYSPCITTCPRETCDNLMLLKDQSHLCSQDACVEGCFVKSCPMGQVYSNDSYTECVPKGTCKAFCMEIDGKIYSEGDVVKVDDCQTCFCSRGKVVCKGEPCTTTITPLSTTTQHEEPIKCVDGWTAWINQDPNKEQKINDIEPLPTGQYLRNIKDSAVCNQNQMIDVRCRSTKDHLTPKETGLNVECSLETGLYCQGQPDLPCIDFEISVLCQCPTSTTEKSETTTVIEECLMEQPYKPHSTDCHLFYHCQPGVRGNEFVEKSCGPDMFYNPQALICDWPANVLQIKPECSDTTPFRTPFTTSTTPSVSLTTSVCKDGEKWSDCAINCNKACNYYQRTLFEEGKCIGGSNCVSGCVPPETASCPPGKFWRDAMSCVDEADCTCTSHNGEPVLPGVVFKESECEICQCINNYYTCNTLLCNRTTILPTTESSTEPVTLTSSTGSPPIKTEKPTMLPYTVLTPSTVSPPPNCESNRFVPLIQYLNDQVTFGASSSKGPEYEPANSVLNGKGGHWEPEYSTDNQWLMIKFSELEPIYGVVLQGVEDKFVTSYNVAFSENGNSFSPVLDDTKEPRVFSGPVDGLVPVEQKFHQPIEARAITIVPLTWHNSIAMQVELLGCQDLITTPTPKVTETVTIPTMTTESNIPPVCDDRMGLTDGLIYPEQVSSSSSSIDLLANLKLDTPNVWHPQLDNPHQFVQIDFLEPRNITGITTKGGEDSWTTAYKVYYSSDGRQWNPVIDQNGSEKEFLGNVDSERIKKNYFDRPLSARYLKVQPIKWHKHIALKLEVIGCFLPYPPVATTTEIVKTSPTVTEKNKVPSTTRKETEATPTVTEGKETTQTTKFIECNVCEGIEEQDWFNCKCNESSWWNGSTCGTRMECPCVIEHVTYPVGTAFIREDCQECMCTLGGNPFCEPKKCDPCNNPETIPIVNELCNCVCKPCPPDTRLCPTSKICINESLWCNGVHDCPDDEKDCPETTTPTMPTTERYTTTVTTPEPPAVCPQSFCPPGYELVLRRPGMNPGVKSRNHRWEDVECQAFICIPIKNTPCLPASCPPGYTIVYEKMSMYKPQKCPRYSCQPPPPAEPVCNVTGRTINTFDKSEFKYDLCYHILAREMYDNKWYIYLRKECSSDASQCTGDLEIYLDDYMIYLYPDMHVEINEYSYTPKDIAQIGDRFSLFEISSVGDVIYVRSFYYGFWVMWDSYFNVKIGVSKKLAGNIDGLCGYFDGNWMNDKQLPDGSPARNTEEFGNSWRRNDTIECGAQTCPFDLRVESQKLCNIVTDPSLEKCFNVLDKDKFMSRCQETTCTCLLGNSTNDDCRCQLLTNFVTECQAADTNIDLTTWRSLFDCPAFCPPPFVHKDCYRKQCEPCCSNLQQVNPCPEIQGVCFPGCFCPEGTVRNGDECVPPTHCRNCKCEWLGNSKLITFDRKNVTFEGNCTYVLSSSQQASEELTYQVLVTNNFCDSGICTEAVTILHDKHIIQIKKYSPSEEFRVELNGEEIGVFPFNASGLFLERSPLEKLRLLIPVIQLELICYQPNFAFTLNVPSHIFGGYMEGLCANCNQDPKDDLWKQDGNMADDMQDFASSWLVTESPPGIHVRTDECTSKKPTCIPPPPEEDPCRKLLNTVEFGACHNFIDPTPYLKACEDSVCSGFSYCDSFAAYARNCLQMGVCLTWRSNEICPHSCPPPFEYQACGSDCKETCDSIDSSCSNSIVEGCFCPQGTVLHNDTCIPKEQCSVCDAKGHEPGDAWYPDPCTKCALVKNSVVQEKTVCPVDTVCEDNMIPVVIDSTAKECCPKYLCVPKTSTTTSPLCSDEPQVPDCGYGQTIKASIGSDGCQKLVCECVPPSECPSMEEPLAEQLPPGFVRLLNASGCCPRYEVTCDSQTCPSAPLCPNYYNVEQEMEQNDCCPRYKCVPPKDVCLYYVGSDNIVGTTENLVAKKIGEQWMEDLCTNCTCEFSDDGPKSKCSSIECLKPEDHQDKEDYVLEAKTVEGQCCPVYERVACLDNERTYKVDDIWQPDPQDSCITMQCVRDNNRVQKLTIAQECTDICDLGYEYRPSEDKSINCCGRCAQVACLFGNQLRNIGDQWYSRDFCTQYSCEYHNGSVYAVSKTTKCPEVDSTETNEFEIEKRYVPERCCPEYVRIACRDNGIIYQPGQQWKPANDNCVTMTCAIESTLTKLKEIESCNEVCDFGYTYVKQEGECCGKCVQSYCVIGNKLYEPGMTWYSEDNCTSYSCMAYEGHLSVATSTVSCPDITDCPPHAIFAKDCCQVCIPGPNKTTDCAADVLDAESTVGMFRVQDKLRGFCQNTAPIEGITECRGPCESTSYFDTATNNWNPIINCQCCQPTHYRSVIVELQCEKTVKPLKRQLRVPVSCACSSCASQSGYEGRKTGVKG